MTPEQRQLARRRLWLGITNVGFWVLAACAGLLWLALGGARGTSPAVYWLIAAGVVMIQAVFDFIGGTLLMPPPRPAWSEFVGPWLRGVLGHTLALVAVGFLSYASFRLTGGFCAAIVFGMVALAFTRRQLLRLIGGVATTETSRDGTRFLTADPADPAFTGGIIGFGRAAESLLPASWLQSLPARELAAETSRRQWQIAQNLPERGYVLLLGWNVFGAATGAFAFHLNARPPVEALFAHGCLMTLWAFAGLLVLPSLSRAAVFAGDHAATGAGGGNIRDWIARFPGITGEDGGANAAVRTIFYPIPSTASRLEQLGNPVDVGFVPGNLARNNLYYSWATFTLLGRAVHCNVGRPALWVFAPSA